MIALFLRARDSRPRGSLQALTADQTNLAAAPVPASCPWLVEFVKQKYEPPGTLAVLHQSLCALKGKLHQSRQ